MTPVCPAGTGRSRLPKPQEGLGSLSRAAEKVALTVRPGDLEGEIAGRIGPESGRDRMGPTGLEAGAAWHGSLRR